MATVLGLDVSTSKVGCVVVDDDNYPVFMQTFILPKDEPLVKKASYLRDRLFEVFMLHKIDYIFIEESKKMFKPGASSANVISKLSTFNGMSQWVCYMMFDIVPEMVSEATARKLCGISVKRGQKAKDVVMSHVIANEPLFEYDKTKFGNIAQDAYDRADALVIARAGKILCSNMKKKNLK